MKKLRGAYEVPILITAAFAAVLIALGVGYKAGDKNVEYEGNLWCISNYIEKEPTEYLADGRPAIHPLLSDKGDWIRKDQVEVDPATNNAEEEAMTLATKEKYFEKATKDEMIAALEKNNEEGKDFFIHHFNATATEPGPCWGTGESEDAGKWINDAIREECLGEDAAAALDPASGEPARAAISGKCGDLNNANAVSAQAIKSLLDKNGSPMRNDANAVLEAARKYSVNPAFLLAVTGAESSFGKAGAGARNKNPGNLRVSKAILNSAGIPFKGHDKGGYTIFNTWRDGLMAMAEVLSRNYLKKGRDTINKIGPTYVGASSSEWISITSSYMKQLCKN